MERRVSLCICTMNRPEDLRKCLGSLAGSLAAPFEVIVSDDSRDERMQGKNREVVADFPGVTYLPGPKRGLSANRNNCLGHVTGDLVAFVDDDVVLHPSFLLKGSEEHGRLSRLHGTEKIIVTGYEIRPDGEARPSNLSFLGFYTGRVPDNGSPDAVCINSSVFPAALFRAARFDENIFYGAEERDISLHALHLGYRILYCPDLANYHFPSSVNRNLYNRPLVTSRIYFGLKRYWLYERSVPKFVLFNAYALANAVGSRLKEMKFREGFQAAGAFFEAWRLFRSKVRHDGSRP
jgi:glycosyltransferase involved in cell wall biosynthesis